jgi:signal transduction histidine kinase
MIDRLNSLLRRLRLSAFAFPLAVLVAGLMLSISEAGYHQAGSQLSKLIHRGQARLEISHLVRHISDAESSQRGFLLTGQVDYLDPYRNASAAALSNLTRLKSLYGSIGDGDEQPDLAQLDGQVRTRLGEIDEVLALYNAGRDDTARELVSAGLGRTAMDRIRTLTDTLLARQNGKVSQELGYVFDTLLLNRVGIATMTAVSLLVLGMYLRQRRQGDNDRREQQRQLLEERDRLEIQVLHRTAELTELARHLETTREDERARLARDLHDELGALLTAAKLDVARMRPKLTASAPDLLPRLQHLVEALNSGIALKRRIIEDLRPSTLSTLGLVPALEILCNEFSDRLGAQLHTHIEPVALTPSCELTVFRLVQESLTNIAKHANARHISVDVHGAGAQVDVRIRDDGVGFDMLTVGAARHGLVGMRYRVQAEGGVLTVSAQPGQGTEVHASLPAWHGDHDAASAPDDAAPVALVSDAPRPINAA